MNFASLYDILHPVSKCVFLHFILLLKRISASPSPYINIQIPENNTQTCSYLSLFTTPASSPSISETRWKSRASRGLIVFLPSCLSLCFEVFLSAFWLTPTYLLRVKILVGWIPFLTHCFASKVFPMTSHSTTECIYKEDTKRITLY